MGPQLGFPPQSQEKAEYAYKQALSGMDKMRSAGVKIGFGTDLLGSTYVQECREFTLRSEVFTPARAPAAGHVDQRRDDDAAGQDRLHRAGRLRRPAAWSTATR